MPQKLQPLQLFPSQTHAQNKAEYDFILKMSTPPPSKQLWGGRYRIISAPRVTTYIHYLIAATSWKHVSQPYIPPASILLPLHATKWNLCSLQTLYKCRFVVYVQHIIKHHFAPDLVSLALHIHRLPIHFNDSLHLFFCRAFFSWAEPRLK